MSIRKISSLKNFSSLLSSTPPPDPEPSPRSKEAEQIGQDRAWVQKRQTTQRYTPRYSKASPTDAWQLVWKHARRHLSCIDICKLSELCTAFRQFTNPILNSEFVLRIPRGKKVTMRAPQTVIISSIKSLPVSATNITFVGKHQLTTIPPQVTHLAFEGEVLFNMEILPQTLVRLSFTHFAPEFDFQCTKLPNTITYLKLANNFNTAVSKFPDSLTHLMFGNSFNQNLDTLPAKLTHLSFGSTFNANISTLPATLQHFSILSSYSQPTRLPPLPNSLTYLWYPRFYAHNNYFPPLLTHLICSHDFNLPIDNLPSGLTHLKLGSKFNQPVDELPKSLVSICLLSCRNFNQPLDNLPSTITHISIESATFRHPIDKLPQSLTHLIFKASSFALPIGRLPNSITHLDLGLHTGASITTFPPQLIQLSLDNYEHTIPSLPATLYHLRIGRDIDPSLISIPASITHLELPKDSKYKLTLPKSLTVTKYGLDVNWLFPTQFVINF